jgi:hypothetical protein
VVGFFLTQKFFGMNLALTIIKQRERKFGVNSMLMELATVNFITICLIVFGAFALIRIVRTYLES